MRSYPLALSNVVQFPARLVTITRLDGAVLRIAEADETITVSAQAYVPLPGSQISGVKHILNGDMPSMEITFAHSDGGTLDSGELNNGFWDGATVQVYVVDRSSISSLGDPLFTGVIDTVTIDPIDAAGSFDIRGVAAQAEAFIQTFAPMCRTDLFSPLCQLNEADFDHAGTVGTIVDRFTFTVAGLGAPPADGWFNQGTFVTESGFKAVVANWVQSTNTITTYLPICVARLVVGEDITLYPGCDKRAQTCREKFNNRINHQGEAHFLGVNSIVGV